MDRQVCVIRAVAYSLPTDRKTHVIGTDKSLKTEGLKILSNYIFYFKTVIIGGPKKQNTESQQVLKIIEAGLTTIQTWFVCELREAK